MSMTTPRVTVPVEPTAVDKLEAVYDWLREPDYGDTFNNKDLVEWLNRRPSGLLMRAIGEVKKVLSAAPAPEGGAAQWGWRVRAKPSRVTSHRPWHWQADEPTETTAELCEWEPVYVALAAREEAPAEAGEVTADSLRSVSDETMRALLSCKDVGSGRAHLASIINALRAQPPAREDAQPDAGARLAKAMWGVDLVPATHPAPDALRVAVAALERAREDLFDKADKDEMPEQWSSVQSIDQALTALASGSGDHAELARLAESATPGPWFETEGHPSGRTYGIHAEAGPVVVFRGIAKPHGQGEHNAAFIAAANPATVLALLAEIAALRAANTEAERKLAEARSMLLRWRRHAPTEALEDLTDAWLSKEAERG